MTDQFVPDHSWDGVDRERALAWCRVFFDLPPRFPGATMMVFGYRGWRGGVPPGFVGWRTFADAAESLGFTPDTYYLLRLALRDELTLSGDPADRFTPDDLALWARFPRLLGEGETPLRAVQRIRTGDAPRGRVVGDDGSVIAE